jgi:DNA polymerase III alpha subunit (gram-positive type)
LPLTLNRPIVFFDLETTGTDVQNDRIVQISLLKLHPNNNEEILTLLVNPGIPIPAAASAVQIVIMVYKLYVLTHEEVKVIDPNIEAIISKKEYDKFEIK